MSPMPLPDLNSVLSPDNNSADECVTTSLTPEHRRPEFQLGQLVATPGAIAALAQAGCHALSLLSRHAAGDWGDVSAEDKALNDAAALQGDRLLSAYVVAPDVRIWVITEWDRSVTTLLLPSEY